MEDEEQQCKEDLFNENHQFSISDFNRCILRIMFYQYSY